MTTERPNILAWRDSPRHRRREKYANVRTEVDGMKFDSKAELKRWNDLQWMLRSGLIVSLQRQVRYVLIPRQERPSGGVERECAYVADFVYTDKRNGRLVVEDVKGAATPEYRIKRKLMLHVHGIEVSEVKA